MQALNSTTELDALIARSKDHPVLLFKHSSTCPISASALRELERVLRDTTLDYGLIVVQDQPALSADLARRTGIRHESPQAMVLCAGEVTWHASHRAIQAPVILSALQGAAD